MPQPPYSEDLASSDFYVLHTVKDWLKRIDTVDGGDIFEYSLEILRAIPVDELKRVFIAWIDHNREVSERNDDYIA
jgi:hypothetical protein